MQLNVHTTTAVDAGAQLFVSYGPMANRAPTAVRQAQLRERYAFTCTCPACTRYEAEGARPQRCGDGLKRFSLDRGGLRPEPAARPAPDAWRCHEAGCDGAVDPRRPVCAACRKPATKVDETRAALAQAAELVAAVGL